MDVDDYTIGRDLGLTISRVRSLKERKELKYPHKGYEWTSEFLKYAQNAKYDEVQLNPKLFACRADVLFDMCKQIALEGNEEFNFDIKNNVTDCREIVPEDSKFRRTEICEIHITTDNTSYYGTASKLVEDLGGNTIKKLYEHKSGSSGSGAGKCAVCNGTGTVKYYYGESTLEAVLSGHNDYEWGPCGSCNGTGKAK